MMRWTKPVLVGLSVAVAGVALSLSAPPTARADGLENLTVHGYLTQAYATSSDSQVLGIPTDGTTDYRTMALQFRYAISDTDAVVVQLSHETAGDSPFDALRDEIELDWAFYEHQFPIGTSVRVGRIPIPFGIYNELRDVGTVLEFYRPPTSMYFEGGFSNESVDGVVLSHRFDWSWGLSVDGYYGSWTRNDSSIPIDEVAVAKIKDAYGAQLWLEPPVDGLRIGAAFQSWKISEGLERLRVDEEDPADIVLFSVDFDRDRWYVRGEYQMLETLVANIPELDYEGWYVQAGVRVGSWAFHALYEESELIGTSPFGRLAIDPWYDDLSVGVNYRFSPSVVLKAEFHDIESSLVEEVDLGVDDRTLTEVFIASLSVSF